MFTTRRVPPGLIEISWSSATSTGVVFGLIEAVSKVSCGAAPLGAAITTRAMAMAVLGRLLAGVLLLTHQTLMGAEGSLSAEPAGVADIQNAARAVDPTLLLTALPLETSLGWSRGISATVTTLFTGLGVLALILASVGIYGVVAFAVAGRHREMGVRLAFGATVRSVLALLLRETMWPVAIGAVVGIAGAAALSSVLSSVLFGISPADPIQVPPAPPSAAEVTTAVSI